MHPLHYILIRSHRRTLSLQISKKGELIARAPMRMSEGVIVAFIERKHDWIIKHQEKMKDAPGKMEHKEYGEEDIKLLKEKLKVYIIPRVHELREGQNLPKITSIKITKSEGRWGSCSAKNGLCFSYRLAEYIDTPGCTFIDAIIIHELAHLREKNHQKPFWNLVHKMMPQYEEIIRNSKSLGAI